MALNIMNYVNYFYTETNLTSTEVDEKESIKMQLKFKRYVFDNQKRMIQTS